MKPQPRTQTYLTHTNDGPSVSPTSNPLHADPGPHVHRRTGKVARLPAEDRELLNLMLHDGAPYARIIKKLAERGHTLNVDNISRWHAGGFQDWLQDQAWLEEMRTRLDFAGKVVHESNGSALDAASLRIAVTQMYTLLMSFDPVILKEKLSANPGAYSRILNSLCKLTEGSIRCERRKGFPPHPSSPLLHPSAAPPPSRGNSHQFAPIRGNSRLKK